MNMYQVLVVKSIKDEARDETVIYTEAHLLPARSPVEAVETSLDMLAISYPHIDFEVGDVRAIKDCTDVVLKFGTSILHADNPTLN